MQYRNLGRTGIKVSPYALGTLMFATQIGNPDPEDSIRIIHKALDAGINLVDTADSYRDSEETVGRALKGRRDNVVLATKVSRPMGTDPNQQGASRRWIMTAVENSLRRLQTDRIDLYQIQRPDPDTDIEETLSALTDLVRSGKIRASGTSMMPASNLVEAHWVAERRGLERFRTEQPPYSILNRSIEREVLPVAQKYGMGVLPWGPLGQGMLTGRVRRGQDNNIIRAKLLTLAFSDERRLDARRPVADRHLVQRPHRAARQTVTTGLRPLTPLGIGSSKIIEGKAEMALQKPPTPVTTPVVVAPDIGPSPKAAIGWLAGGAALTFAVSWLGTTVLGLQHDLYYLIYFTFALGYLDWFATRSRIAWHEVLRRNVWWSLAVGVLVAFAVARQVMGQDGTPHPHGGFFGFELVWRGVIYGTVDALTLFVFPAAAAYLVLRGNRNGLPRKAAFAGLVLLFSLVVSTTYHLGYSTYRGSDLSKPLIGTVMMDVPAILTGNPAGAIVAHATMHTTAVVHQYYGGDKTNRALPPELSSSYPDRPGGTAALAVAAGWVVLIGAVLALNRRRIRELL